MTKSKNIIIKDPTERFWKSVNVPEDSIYSCWEWIGRKNYKGYGDMRIKNKHVMAHRFSFELHGGTIPKGLCVCHKCDNPSCVNPSHLFTGTIQENNMDRDNKGRKALGENNGKSKLTENDVLEILKLFELGYSSSAIARRYNRSHGAITAIKLGRSWKWLSNR